MSDISIVVAKLTDIVLMLLLTDLFLMIIGLCLVFIASEVQTMRKAIVKEEEKKDPFKVGPVAK